VSFSPRSCVQAQTRRVRPLLAQIPRPNLDQQLHRIPYGQSNLAEMEGIWLRVDRTEWSAYGPSLRVQRTARGTSILSATLPWDMAKLLRF
jgi:hypothetical protein